MGKKTEETFVLVTNPLPSTEKEDQEWRGPTDKIKYFTKNIPLSIIEQNLQSLVNALSGVLGRIKSSMEDYKLDEVEVTILITVSGEISILGIGGELGTEGGLKLVFKKNR